MRPNESFSGQGHAIHVCKACSKLDAEEIAFRQHVKEIDQLLDWNGLIRRRNTKAFDRFLLHPDPRVRAYAEETRARDARIREELAQERRALELEEAHWEGPSEEVLALGPNSIEREIEHIVDRARKGEACVVTLGELIFFSAPCGDAWMLDPSEGLSAPLCCSGVAVLVEMEESAEDFRIAWSCDYRLDGDAFLAEERDTSRLERIQGYPVAELRLAIARLTSSLP